MCKNLGHKIMSEQCDLAYQAIHPFGTDKLVPAISLGNNADDSLVNHLIKPPNDVIGDVADYDLFLLF